MLARQNSFFEQLLQTTSNASTAIKLREKDCPRLPSKAEEFPVTGYRIVMDSQYSIPRILAIRIRKTMKNGPNPTSHISAFVALAAALLFCSFVDGQEEVQRGGTNSRSVRKEAVRSIPFNQLTSETQAKLSPIVEKPSIYRRLPVTSIDVDPDMFLFLVRQPEVIVNIWQLMGVTQMKVERTGPFTFYSDDGAGAISNIELVYGTSNKNIYYAEGTYSGPLLKRKLKGRAVLVMQTNYAYGKNGQPTTTNSLDVFLKVENATVNLIAKTLNPIIGPTADHNFVESLKFVQRLNQTTEGNGPGVQKMAYRLTSLTDNVRDQFVQVAGTVYDRGNRRTTLKPPSRNANKQPKATSISVPRASVPGVRRTTYQDFKNGFK